MALNFSSAMGQPTNDPIGSLRKTQRHGSLTLTYPESGLSYVEQGEMIDRLVALAIGRSICLTVYTQAEMILLRVRKRIAETAIGVGGAPYTLTSKDVSVTVGGHTCSIGDMGEWICPSPVANFFSGDFQEVVEINRLQLGLRR